MPAGARARRGPRCRLGGRRLTVAGCILGMTRSEDVWLKDPSALRFRRSPPRSQPVAQPGDKMAAGTEGDSNLPTSHVGREQVLAALKAAFVQGRLAKDE